MIPYQTGQIARITGASVLGDPDLLISHIHTDTRLIDRPDGSMFIALKGPNHDGHLYLDEAYTLGIRAFLVSHLTGLAGDYPQATFLSVPDTLAALQTLAGYHRRGFSGKLIGITGSNGKTIVKEWLSRILQSEFKVSKSPKSYNSQLGVPLSVLGISPADDFAIMEAGISMPGEMNILQKILNPDIGLITNIGGAHQENFADLRSKAREKILLFKSCHTVYYCLDHLLITEELEKSGFQCRKISWSRWKESMLRIIDQTVEGGKCHLKGTFGTEEIELVIPFTDPASVENIIHIWLILIDMGFPREKIQHHVSNLEPIRMRLEQKAGINGCTLINDYYNSDIQSLKIALDLLFQQTSQDRKSLVLSDIPQTGIPEEALYREINKLLENRNLHHLIGIGPALSRNRQVFSQSILSFSSTPEFLAGFNMEDFNREAILLKGARAFEFERISRVLEEKLHATILEIRMNDVRHNLNYFRGLLNPGTRIMVMVKAFSYGSGGFEMARFLANERVDYLGVAFADEGIELRRAGIRTPVMVMNPDYNQSDLLAEYNLEPEIYNWAGLRAFCRTILELGIPPYPVHVKIDTGMHRLGFPAGEAEKLSGFLTRHPEIYIRSVFSHLAAGEDPQADDFTAKQFNSFNRVCEHFSSRLEYPFLRHILNSAGIERFPEAQSDMVRLGIGLYGFQNSGKKDVIPIATLKTSISQVHDLAAGESVGYGRHAILRKPSRIAVIPIGYADGIDRRLGNGTYGMVVNGQTARTIGNICMDMCMLDVTGIEAVEGDEVTVFGPMNPVTKMASIMDTIPYEIITAIPPRVKRVYLFE